jgi:hypothetical protein
LVKAAGVDIFEDDPEATMLKGITEKDYPDKFADAQAAKRLRLNPPTQLPTNLMTGQPVIRENPDQLTAQLKELQKNPTANRLKIKEVAEKLQAMLSKG